MRTLIIALLLPLFIFSQDDCGDRPKKPVNNQNQTNKEYKKSTEYLIYKKMLKDWKHCISPVGIDERLEQQLIQKNEEVVNPCGDRPEKPERKKNQSIDEHRKTPNHIEYRQKLKEWKSCMSPISNLKTNIANIDNEENTKTISLCGDKPKKPARAEGLNHEEYRQTIEHVKYRQKLKEWKMCIKNEK